MAMNTILSEDVGYFVLLGVGSFMDQVVTFLVKAESKWLGIRETSEWFSRAGRNIKTGLIASSGRINCIVSCIGLDLGAYLVTIIHRCILIWNKWSVLVAAGAHKVHLCFALMTNTIVTTMLVLGSAAVVSALTSVHTLVATFLIPIGVIIYTFSGGLKATFFADYLNSALLFVVILIFVTIIYFNNSEIGGISGLLEKLVSLVSTNPVQGKAGGAYLTMTFTGALVFGIINIVGNFEQCLLIRHFGNVP